jgi:hypothetical protein
VTTLRYGPRMAAPDLGAGRGDRVAMALWPGETRRMLSSPIVIGAFALTALISSRWGPTGIRGFDGLIFGLFIFLAANLAALRTRRDRTEELCESLPADATARTGGLLLAMAGPGLAVALLTAGVWALNAGRIAAEEPLGIWEAAQGPLLVVLFGMLGVALARWFPFLQAALPGVVGLAMVTGGLASSCGAAARCSTVWLGLWVNRAIDSGGTFVGIRAGSAGWHAVYLSGLIVVVAVLAVARDRRGPAQMAAGAAGLGLVVISGFLQLP